MSKYRGEGEAEREDASTTDTMETQLLSNQDSENEQLTTTVPLIEERVEVSKRTEEDTTNIVKKPITETKTIEVPVTHEEISIERRKPTGEQTHTQQKPITSTEEIEIPVKREEIEVNKKPYIREEVVVKKETYN